MIAPGSENGQNLDRLLHSYRQATEYGEAGPDFMPMVWQRIEARRRNSLIVERFARLFASATCALAVLAVVLVSFAGPRLDQDSWVETLADQNPAQDASYYEPVRLSTDADRAVPAPSGFSGQGK